MAGGFQLNPLVMGVDSPPIPEAQGWKALYSGALGPMIDLSQAVPGTPPPAAMLEKLGEIAASGDATRYGPILGDLALREAYAAEVSRLYGARILPESIAITAGCNMAFVVAAMALAKAGDDIILPQPAYFNHAMTLSMLGIRAVPLPASAQDGFVPEADEAASLITPRTRAIVLVTPNNPTGAVYPPDLIAAFGALARKVGIALILDETYRDFLPDASDAPHPLFTDPEWGNTLISLYSFSKAYAIPGHRLGAMIAAPRVMDQIAKILDCVQICPARPAQKAVVWAMDGLREWREAQRAELIRRAAACRAALSQAEGWRLHSAGAYFAYVSHPFAGMSAKAAAKHLAISGGVLGLPGSYFGVDQEAHLRLAFANVGVEVLETLAGRLSGLA